MEKQFNLMLHWTCDYLAMLESKLYHMRETFGNMQLLHAFYTVEFVLKYAEVISRYKRADIKPHIG